MGKTGRKPKQITLTTESDPALWKYTSLAEALCANIGEIASLINDTKCAFEKPAREGNSVQSEREALPAKAKMP